MPGGARLDAPGTLHHVMVRGIGKYNLSTTSPSPHARRGGVMDVPQSTNSFIDF